MDTYALLPDLDSVPTMKVCRVCLSMNVKMYHMSEHRLNVIFQRVTSIEINTEDKLPKMLCWECVARLSSAHNFLEKALKTQWILTNKINNSRFITTSDIESIDKAEYQLESKLGFKVYHENDINLYIIEESDESDKSDDDSYNGNSELYDKEEAEICQFNDGINNDIEQTLKKKVTDEKDRIRRENLDETEEKDETEFQPLEIGNENVSEDANISEKSVEENLILGEAREVCEEVKRSQKNIHHRVTLLRNGRGEALPHCKELRVVLEIMKVTDEKDRIKRKNLDETEEKDETEFQPLKIGNENVSEDANISEQSVEENLILGEAREVCEEVKGSQKNIHHRVTLLRNGRGEALPHCKELRVVLEDIMLPSSKHKTQDSLYQFTAQSSKDSEITNHPQIQEEILENNFVEKLTINEASGSVHSNLSVLQDDTESSKNVFICDICGKQFHIKNTLIGHIKKHKMQSCTYCNYKAYQRSDIKRHMNCMHKNKNSFNCSFCNRKMYDKSTLNRHVNAIHTKTNNYNCSFCSYKTYYKCELTRHINAKHTKTNVYKCTFCSYKTYYERALPPHINAKHTKIDDYNCALCSYKTYYMTNFTRHLYTKH